MATEKINTEFQVYAIRNGRWELDGCWGSEYAIATSKREAREICRSLHDGYPDTGWGFESCDGERTVCFKAKGGE
jgi:hypothetical protein